MRRLTETAHVGKEHQLGKIVHGRVDPATTLREQDTPRVGCDRHGVSIGDEFGLVVREVLEDERCQVSIFTEGEQVLLVQRIENTLLSQSFAMSSNIAGKGILSGAAHIGVVVDDQRTDEEWFSFVGGTDSVHCETVESTASVSC